MASERGDGLSDSASELNKASSARGNNAQQTQGGDAATATATATATVSPNAPSPVPSPPTINDSQTQSNASAFCVRGCGFYGSPSTLMMCSKCHADEQVVAKKNMAQVAMNVNVGGSVSVDRDAVVAVSMGYVDKLQRDSDASPSASSPAAVLDSTSSPCRSPSLPLHSSSRQQQRKAKSPDPLFGFDTFPPLAPSTNNNKRKLDDIEQSPNPACSLALQEPPLQRENQEPSPSSSKHANNTLALIPSTQDADSDMQRKKSAKQSSRCFVCSKKLGLTGFKCKCNNAFCPVHRYADQHNCDFDYKKQGKEILAKANPLVVSAKLEKI
eukprot:CAMPEP_0184706216 /NCGR_PEP_ID=MMETSP0313-20130426/36646_1 /TAXON_ID=2792 /ORGANISM="Porphyridium aerugineum, Strain SAG 1380-2" /LENGTH=326 /DNA_ID=CAMNT_0027167763 /DNA_START=670 /DNA_END=1650 /DNA_ORIENTATION=+